MTPRRRSSAKLIRAALAVSVLAPIAGSRIAPIPKADAERPAPAGTNDANDDKARNDTAPTANTRIRIGIIGLDTSHSPAFTKVLNDPKAAEDIAGCPVVAAYPKGSADIPSSVERVPGYTREVEELGVKIVDSIDALVREVDAVLLESNDGRPHLEQLLPVLRAKKACFVDKPIAGSLVDALAIFEASKKYGTPVFSSSSLRYIEGAGAVRQGAHGTVLGCDTYSPCSLEPSHPDLFWYGIHGVEALFTVMGTGCGTVSRTHADGIDVVVGDWQGGRIGTFRGIRSGKSGYGGTVYTDKEILQLGGYAGYRPLVADIVTFFRTGKPPVTMEETIEIYAFMEAADESKRRGGSPVSVREVIDKARAGVAARLAAAEAAQ
ncbi:MAG: gfo/Idh/MocA family oxidoreductase [Planctomycetes bacterium]|nr:gfo/Idh/MocA family oxidoreductase [Planctomycetota bacterium]